MKISAKVLILSAKRYDFTPTGGERLRGTSIYYANDSAEETDDSFGTPGIEGKGLPYEAYESLRITGSGFYDVTFDMTVQKDKSGQNQNMLKVVAVGAYLGPIQQPIGAASK